MNLNKLSFYSLLLFLVWLPVPLASNRIWAWSIAGMVIGVITLGMVFSYRSDLNAFPVSRLKRFIWLFLPLVLFQLWTLVQLMPMELTLLEKLSPVAAQLHSDAKNEMGMLSVDRFATYTSLIKGLIYTLFAFTAVVLISNKDRVRLVLLALLGSGTIQALYGAMVVLLDMEYSPVLGIKLSNVATGSFIYKNHLANYLMLCLCMGIGLLISQLHVSASGSWNIRLLRWSSGVMSSKMFVRCALIMMVIALVMTRSRMGNTAFFTATIVGGLVALLFYKNKPRALVPLVMSLLVVDVFVVGSIFGLEKVKDRLEQTAFASETRDEVVTWSMDLISASPLTGTGMGSFYSVFPTVSQANIGYYDHAHNDYVQFAVEAGIPATLMLGAMCLYALFLTIKAMVVRNSKILKGTALGCFMAIIGMLIHISVDFNLQPSANAMTFILILVMAGCASDMPSSKTSSSNPDNAVT